MRLAILSAAALMLAACGNNGQQASDSEADTAAPEADVSSEEPVETDTAARPGAPLEAGEYCYFRDDENVTEGLEITVGSDGILSGSNYGVIHQESAGYYASFETTLSNGVPASGNDVNFDHVTEVDGDTQSGTVVWSITPETAAPDGLDTLLASTSCEGLVERIFPSVDEE